MGLAKNILDGIVIAVAASILFFILISSGTGIIKAGAISTGGLFMLLFFCIFAVNIVRMETKSNNNSERGGKKG